MSDFYRTFEDRFRGSQDLISRRLWQYQPFVQPVADAKLGNRAIDLGCGRGEWLRMLRELGQDATGVDLDDEMLQAARESGLDVQTTDALHFLKQQPDSSTPVISAFHLVEHLPFDTLIALIHEAQRCLMPGGVIILETPNPENLVVSTRNFFLDPTHIRPIPPLLLSYLVETAGFSPVKVVRLQEDADLVNRSDVKLINVLEGVSPDYAIVAQKTGHEALSAALGPAFERAFGLELSTLANRYDEFIRGSIQTVGDEADLRLHRLSTEFSEMSKSLEELKESVSLLKSEVEHLSTQTSSRILHRGSAAPKAIGQRDKAPPSDRPRPVSNGILAPLGARLSHALAPLVSEETKRAFRQLRRTVASPSDPESYRRDGKLSPRAAYFYDRLQAGPKTWKGR